jgi:secreted PhoX family phosphatase
MPLRALGRFCHEGIVVTSDSGIAYQTEDRPDSLFYRFIPDRPSSLQSGKLQALAFANKPRFDTRNWQDIHASVGQRFPVRWIDLNQVDSEEDNLRRRGWLRGAALFARGEGICFQGNSILFGCTTGGKDSLGQIWRYHASPDEGTLLETERPPELELFLESTSAERLENPDQFSATPWGDLMVCEDGKDPQHLVGVTPDGECYRFARNSRDPSELAGVCFSPDGTTMFVNNLEAGLTFAVTGPWKKVL